MWIQLKADTGRTALLGVKALGLKIIHHSYLSALFSRVYDLPPTTLQWSAGLQHLWVAYSHPHPRKIVPQSSENECFLSRHPAGIAKDFFWRSLLWDNSMMQNHKRDQSYLMGVWESHSSGAPRRGNETSAYNHSAGALKSWGQILTMSNLYS